MRVEVAWCPEESSSFTIHVKIVNLIYFKTLNGFNLKRVFDDKITPAK